MAFSGRAIHSTGVFDTVAEDVNDLISMISPFETPVLDAIGDAPRPANNVLHEWLEDSLNPNTIVSSSAITSTTAATSLMVHVGGSAVTGYLQSGMVLKVVGTGEYVQISAVTGGDNILVTRAFGGTLAASYGASANLYLISDAALEGADVSTDTSRPRSRKTNYTQIFKKDIIVSGTVQAVQHLGGVSNEYEYQKDKRLKEILRDLEKATIQGKLSGNSIGTASVYRTMKGIWDFITTNVGTLSTATSLTPTALDSIVGMAWDRGGTDNNLIVADANFKKVIDTFNNSRVRTVNEEDKYRQSITEYESTFGIQRVILGRWMPTNSLMVISTNRIRVLPLNGRSFAHTEVARTGDAQKGMILGEYTVEVMNEDGMAKLYV